MTALPQDAVADRQQRIAELERQLETAVNERDAAIERQTASALVNFRLKNELRAVTDREKASAEILNAIANTQGDAGHALQRIAETTQHFFNSASVTLRIAEGDQWVQTVRVGSSGHLTGSQPTSDLATRGSNLPGTVYQENRQVHIPDLDNLDPTMAAWPVRTAREAGIRTVCGTPLRRDGKAIGALIVYRDRLAAFTDDDLALQQSFADQAVIAIENARLFSETEKALARQTATSDILRVISSSPTDVQPVFDAIVQSTVRLLGCETSFIQRCDGTHFWTVARCTKEGLVPVFHSRHAAIDPSANFPSRAIVAKQTLYLPDWSEIELPEFERRIQRELGYNSAIYLPLLREGECIGILGIAGSRPRMFSEADIALAESFSDQALIAIENTRLFNETKEALERQTATADILKVIASSPSDVQPVFEAIVNSAAQLFEPCAATITTLKDDKLHWNAAAASIAGFDVERTRTVYPIPFDLERAPSARAILERRIIELPDVESPDTPEFTRRAAAAGRFRSITFVPLVDQDQGIGTIIFTHPQAGYRFSERQLALIQTFADQAVIAIQNARLFNETKEALERQTATADILKVIASSPSDTTPVFDAIATSANRLLGGFSTAVFRFLDGSVHLAAFTPVSPAADSALEADFPKPVDEFEPFQLAQQGKPFPILDTEEVPFAPIKEIARLHGFRSMLFVPLMNGGVPIGIISVTRSEPGAFSPNHVQLLQTFADQAVIAIENVRLFNETQEALERQTATADILKVIASSPSDVQPVFDAIASSSKQLIGGFSATVFRFVDGIVNLAAYTPVSPAADQVLKASFPRPTANLPFFELAKGGEVVQEADSEANPDARLRDVARARGFRSSLFSPLMSQGTPIGLIVVTRKEPGRFAAHHVQLLKTFADQAVIAVENTRLFNEVQERTVELMEALEQQTASAEVLGVISSSAGDLAPVFDAMLSKAMQLCSANFGVLNTYDGHAFHTAATYGLPPAYDEYRRKQPLEYGAGTAPARLLHGEPFVQLTDLPESQAYRNGEPNRRALVDIAGARCLLAVPLVKEERVVGNVMIFRQENRPFSEKQIALLQQFAAQAVIAIENTRLLRELRESTEDLSESLQQQTATSEVLQIISSSPGDLTPVFDKMLENATRVCGAEFGSMTLVEGDTQRQAALYNAPPAFAAVRINKVLQIHPRSSIAAAIRAKQVVQVEDLRNYPAYLEGNPASVQLAELGGARTLVVVPMLRDDEVIGAITVYRQEVRPFGDKQIELLSNFARQAVIAIENARLLRELRQRTDDLTESLQFQTATSDVLKVISRSPDTLQPVLDVIVETSRELCGADASTIFLLRDAKFHVAAISGSVPTHLDHLKANPLPVGQPGSILSRIYDQKHTINLENVLDDPELRQGSTGLGGARALLTVPLLSEGQVIGAITLRNSHLRPFTPRQIQAIETFADQAVIAISNVNLFEQVQQRTHELSKSLDDLRTAQDRLIQTEKLASLGQLTAGIAHEIKNPLNFVNNFAALSAELTDELKDVLKPAVLDETIRAEVDEVTGLLKDNLSKVVQHGKRADSIVKNMLLHSREGSGEHRPADVNALVDESLNLAYHGARAEKPQFNVTLKRDFDPAAGMVEVFPQEITRVLLNLISNGFYAVTRRKADNGGADFEPLVTATTRGGDDHVEIRIRDNGTGIPPEVKERMFNPFFTTKPAGEGTGLGLSMSHDIIVKQHGGTIEVETEPGAFTEFRLVLPRTSRANGNR